MKITNQNKKQITLISLIVLMTVTLFSFQNCSRKHTRSIDPVAKQAFLEERKMFAE